MLYNSYLLEMTSLISYSMWCLKNSVKVALNLSDFVSAFISLYLRPSFYLHLHISAFQSDFVEISSVNSSSFNSYKKWLICTEYTPSNILILCLIVYNHINCQFLYCHMDHCLWWYTFLCVLGQEFELRTLCLQSR
jgi:hypothetical protein